MESGNGTDRNEAGSDRDALIVGHLYGELSEEDEQRLADAMVRDESFAVAMSELRQVLDLYRGLPEEEPPEDIGNAVLAAAASRLAEHSLREVQGDARDGERDGLWAWLVSLVTVPRRRLALSAALSAILVAGVSLALWRPWQAKRAPAGVSRPKERTLALKQDKGLRSAGVGTMQDEALVASADGRRMGTKTRAGRLGALGESKEGGGQQAPSGAPAPALPRRAKGHIGLGRRSGAVLLAPRPHRSRSVRRLRGRPMGLGGFGGSGPKRPASVSARLVASDLDKGTRLAERHPAPVGGHTVLESARVGGARRAETRRASPRVSELRSRARRLLRAGKYRAALGIYRKLAVDKPLSGDATFLLEWAEAELMAGSLERTIRLATRVERTNRKLRTKAVALKRRARERRTKRVRRSSR